MRRAGRSVFPGGVVRILVVSDLHCGSQWGLWPDRSVILPDGRVVPPNKGQKYILRCWEDLCDRVGKFDILVVNGDVIDGEQIRSRGVEAMSTLIPAQVSAAVSLLEPLVSKAREAYFIQGTEYHEGIAGQASEAVARELGARGPARGWHSWEVLDLDVGGVIINFSHGISVSQGLYRMTALDREGVWSALSSGSRKCPNPDVIVRSHAHYYAHVEYTDRHVVITPCWQLQTRYMRRRSVYRMIPDIGAVVLEISPSAKRVGEDPVSVKKILYHLPVLPPHRSEVAGVGQA